jgi:hypothetical protein
MRRFLLQISGAMLAALFLAACDRCGDPAKLNAPSLPKTCHDGNVQ